MPVKQIGSPDPKYLAATDILIGDMSNTNYEFLLFDRPTILLANRWLRDNFPDIGIKTDLGGLSDAIRRSIDNPQEYKEQREHWLKRTIYKPDGHSQERIIDTIIQHSKITNPSITFIHGGSAVQKSNINPLVIEAKKRGFQTQYVTNMRRNFVRKKSDIYVAAHVDRLNISEGYKVHIDHGLKGVAAQNNEAAKKAYERNHYYPLIDLHITEGEASLELTKSLLGPLSNRAVLAGYPKADDLIRLNTQENKRMVYEEFGFDCDKPLITYAPAGKESYMKPGGSLSKEVVDALHDLSSRYGYNILIKLKYPKGETILQALAKLRRLFAV